MKRVKGKEGRHGGARCVGPRHRSQHQKEKHRVGQVQQQAREMMPAGPASVDLHIEHVGKPRERVPEIGVECREAPENPLQGEPLEHGGVFRNVVVVVEVDEPKADHLPVNGQRGRDEQQRDQDFFPVKHHSHVPLHLSQFRFPV